MLSPPACTGYIPPGSITPSIVHGPNQTQPWATATASTSGAIPLIVTSGATPLSPPSHPHTSPTRTALHSIFDKREHHLKGLVPAAAFARKHSFTSPLARPLGNLLDPSIASPLVLGRSESAPGTQLHHRRVKRMNIQEMEDMQWERKSQPMKRKSNNDT